MVNSSIKNIVFDIGNVLVRWSPETIVKMTFDNSYDHAHLANAIFNHDYWSQLNEGKLTEVEAKQLYAEKLQLPNNLIDSLFIQIKSSLSLIVDSQNLMQRLHQANYRIFALSDNVHEIVAYLKQRYDFWQYFSGAVISAEIGCLKPNAEIYQHLLTQYSLQPVETVFIDDLEKNIDGARAQGIHGIQFLNPQQCEADLIKLGVAKID